MNPLFNMTPYQEIFIIANLVAIACALPGVFLLLRRMTLMSDAISHAILPGIVVVFFLVKDVGSPLLFVGAVVMGLVTVSLTELVNKTGLVKEDAAIGLIFPFLFSIGVILVSLYAENVHLDIDAVLLGELAFAWLDRVPLGAFSLPKSMVTMGIISLLNGAAVFLFYKELKLATFDAGLAAVMGFLPSMIHYGLMLSVSITAVGAFDSVGSILVVALMIAPPAAAYLLADDLRFVLLLSILFGILSASLGFFLALALDVSISGAMAVMSGLLFGLTFLFAPRRGVVTQSRNRRNQRLSFSETMLLVHIMHHENQPNSEDECDRRHLTDHINWTSRYAETILKRLLTQRDLILEENRLLLTRQGRQRAVEAMVNK